MLSLMFAWRYELREHFQAVLAHVWKHEIINSTAASVQALKELLCVANERERGNLHGAVIHQNHWHLIAVQRNPIHYILMVFKMKINEFFVILR